MDLATVFGFIAWAFLLAVPITLLAAVPMPAVLWWVIAELVLVIIVVHVWFFAVELVKVAALLTILAMVTLVIVTGAPILCMKPGPRAVVQYVSGLLGVLMKYAACPDMTATARCIAGATI